VGLELAGKRFHNCRFSRAQLKDADLSDSVFRMCFFDFAGFDRVRLHHINVQCSVFAGASLNECDFSDSDILHTNFNGIHARETSFNDSDLYFSRYVQAQLQSVSFIDCNLKKVQFIRAELERVSFKYSNFEEAVFSEEEIYG
jgi:uncharacterized protein YjbI with pentapeptide repeats